MIGAQAAWHVGQENPGGTLGVHTPCRQVGGMVADGRCNLPMLEGTVGRGRKRAQAYCRGSTQAAGSQVVRTCVEPCRPCLCIASLANSAQLRHSYLHHKREAQVGEGFGQVVHETHMLDAQVPWDGSLHVAPLPLPTPSPQVGGQQAQMQGSEFTCWRPPRTRGHLPIHPPTPLLAFPEPTFPLSSPAPVLTTYLTKARVDTCLM